MNGYTSSTRRSLSQGRRFFAASATLLAGALLASAAVAQGPPPGATTTAPSVPLTVVAGGTATWGLSTYLNSANFGRPVPLPTAYVAPSTFDAQTRLSTWGNATGHIWSDGSASLAYAGASVNFTSTSGAWLRLRDLRVELDKDGNGAVSAEVSYGTSANGAPPSIVYDAQQAPAHGPIRINIVNLSGNTAPASVADGVATWTALRGEWTAAFTDVLQAASWVYAGQVSNTTADRNPLPFTFTATIATAP